MSLSSPGPVSSPSRWACVDVPALPLQLLLRTAPDWVRMPVAVVERDEPQGRILWVNEVARRHRVLPGRSYAEGLSLAAGLRAGVVGAREIRTAVDELATALRGLSPAVESGAGDGGSGEPGVFWLDASGLERLYPSLDDWAQQLEGAVRGLGLRSSVVVGFERFNSYAIARALHGVGRGNHVRVLRDRDEERRFTDRVRLDRLHLDPKLRDALDRLGIVDVAGLRALPSGGILARFGAAAHDLHRAVRGEKVEPLVGELPEEPIVEEFEPDPEEPGMDAGGLVFLIGQRLQRIRQELARRGQSLRVLVIELRFEKARPRTERVAPAEPTLDVEQVLGLVKLRLESLDLVGSLEAGDALAGFALFVDAVRATRQQLELFAEAPRRDLAVANRALARLRAEFGDETVLRAELRAAHLPEARFRFVPLANLRVAEFDREGRFGLVRRILDRPRQLADQRPGPDGWLAGGLEAGPVVRTSGPWIVSGGWWAGVERTREYHYAETRSGPLLWLFFDRVRRRWFLHGTVE